MSHVLCLTAIATVSALAPLGAGQTHSAEDGHNHRGAGADSHAGYDQGGPNHEGHVNAEHEGAEA